VSAQTPGLVCAHHHLYSALARGMPAPPRTPTSFLQVLEQIWWRLDTALDLEMLRASARLGAVEALLSGTTGIVDHHESPHAIEGSLDVIADACAEVGVRVVCAYGVTDRHGADGARRGLAENERFLRAGGRGLVGVHAAFTCTDDTLAAAAGLAADLGVGVHVHVAEGPPDADAGARLADLARDDWLLVHCVLVSVVNLLLIVGVGAAYGVPLPVSWGVLAVTLVLGAATFCALGAAVSALVRNSEAAPAVVQFVQLPLVFLSGSYFPIHSAVLTHLADALPVKPFNDAVLAAITSHAGLHWKEQGVLLAWGVVGGLVAVRRFRWDPRPQ